MWKVTAPDGRVAWFVADEPDHLREMVAELFPGVEDVDVVEVVEVVEDATEVEPAIDRSSRADRPPRSG